MNNIKRIYFTSVVLLLSLSFVSCKKEAKKEPAQFSIEPQTITVNWTGYKTTDKVAVKGEFTEISVKNTKQGLTAIEALNGSEFEIPVSSLTSGNPDRDGKLKELFFGVMEATLTLNGTLLVNSDGSGSIDLRMNGIQKKLPIKHVISGQLVEISGTMNLDDWNTQSAWESIHKACFELHKGPDGVSKTWKEVGVNAAIYLKKK